jgi:hypothetical protein
MTRVWVQFEFTAPAKVSGPNLDRIAAIVREWAAERFHADHVEASTVIEAHGQESADRSYPDPERPGLAARMNSADLKTHVEALEEFRDALRVYHTWKLQGVPKFEQAPEGRLVSFPKS